MVASRRRSRRHSGRVGTEPLCIRSLPSRRPWRSTRATRDKNPGVRQARLAVCPVRLVRSPVTAFGPGEEKAMGSVPTPLHGRTDVDSRLPESQVAASADSSALSRLQLLRRGMVATLALSTAGVFAERGWGATKSVKPPHLPPGFSDTFKSRFIKAGGLRQHAVIGGDGP